MHLKNGYSVSNSDRQPIMTRGGHSGGGHVLATAAGKNLYKDGGAVLS